MPAWRCWWVVLVLRPSVKQVLVGHKLNVSDFEFHVQCETLTCILQDLYSLDLLWGKGCDDAFI